MARRIGDVMSKSRKVDDGYDDLTHFYGEDTDLEMFLDMMSEQSTIRKRQRNRKYRARQRVEDFEDARWLQNQIEDWSSHLD